MPNSDLNFQLPTVDSDQDLFRWIAQQGPGCVVRTFYIQEKLRAKEGEEHKILTSRVWIVVTTDGSGNRYVAGNVFRESYQVSGKPPKIVCVAVALAILWGQIKIDFDAKRRIVKIYGAPDGDDLNYPRETMLMEYCFGRILF